ncbi:hypothetical protein ABMA58_20190, partial [Oceanospirillum sp. HFRX-1_2]
MDQNNQPAKNQTLSDPRGKQKNIPLRRFFSRVKEHYEFLLALFTWDFVGFYTFETWIAPEIRPDYLPEPNLANLILVCVAFLLFLLYLIYSEFFRQRWPKLATPILIGTLLIL